MLLHGEWPTGEESKLDGETVQAIKGTLDVGTDMNFPEYQSQINGTLAFNGTSLILEAHGIQLDQYETFQKYVQGVGC